MGLSAPVREASLIAARNGDRDYILVDKDRGEIFMFQDGKPVFRDSALTGLSLADRLAPGALDQPFTQNPKPEEKITPAGRYTVAVEDDPRYGPTLAVNEIQGKDWDIAIHKIFLGVPRERRGARLASSNGREKHITWGCVDVSGETMKHLVEAVPNEDSTPLYILPYDQTNLAAFFPPLRPAARTASQVE